MIPLIVLLILGAIIILYIVIGMGKNDLQEVRARQVMKKQPNARTMRSRPWVYIVISGTLTDVCLKSIKATRYKKSIITQINDVPNDTLAYHLDGTSELAPYATLTAVQQLASNPKQKAVAVTPIMSFEQSIIGIFHLYSKLARMPFAEAHAGFGRPAINTLSRNTTRSRSHLVELAILAIRLFNFFLFMYACYAAAALHQPELVLVYICALSFWLTWCIVRYPYFSLAQKTGLLALMPASFGYFMYLALAAPIHFVVSYIIRRGVAYSI